MDRKKVIMKYFLNVFILIVLLYICFLLIQIIISISNLNILIPYLIVAILIYSYIDIYIINNSKFSYNRLRLILTMCLSFLHLIIWNLLLFVKSNTPIIMPLVGDKATINLIINKIEYDSYQLEHVISVFQSPYSFILLLVVPIFLLIIDFILARRNKIKIQ
jgi:hypothetical protein